MSAIIEFLARSSDITLQGALDDAPDMELSFEQMMASDPCRPLMFFWAKGDDFDRFERALAADETVELVQMLEEYHGRRLYRAKISDDTKVVLYQTDVELGVARLDIKMSTNGLFIRARFPDRETFDEYRRRIESEGVEITVKGIFSHDQLAGNEEGPSEKQREALRVAVQEGYYAVPRDASLEDLADHIEVSPQALSERLRRGTESLIEATVLGDVHHRRD